MGALGPLLPTRLLGLVIQDGGVSDEVVDLLNLVPRAFLRQEEDEREKTLASAGHVIFKHPEKLLVIIEHVIRV